MSLSRRTIIFGAGGAALVAAGAGSWRVTRLPEKAVSPWLIDGPRPRDVRLDAFRYAILAPNPHNRQPWLIGLEGQDTAMISCDLDKLLPATDPFDRQITIGFGTFIELARMAAAERGVRVEVTPFPDGTPGQRLDKSPVARLRFTADPSVAKDPLFPAVLNRHTNRLAYATDRPVPSATMAKIISSPDGYSVDPDFIDPLRAIAVDAIGIEQLTPHTFQESVDLMRIGYQEIDANPDGLALSGPKMEALALAGQLDRKQLADPDSMAFKTGLEMMKDSYGSIPALFWITTPGNSRIDQLEAGRRYVRAQLRATQLGLAVHPLSQALQEYPEMAEHFTRIHALIASAQNARIQMFARIGYAERVRPAARWPLETHLV